MINSNFKYRVDTLPLLSKKRFLNEQIAFFGIKKSNQGLLIRVNCCMFARQNGICIMNKLLFFFFLFLYGLPSWAQVDNYAVVFNGHSSINLNKMPELNGLDKYTIQLWMYPSEWIKDACIFKRGDERSPFRLSLGDAPGRVAFSAGKQTIVIESIDFSVRRWTQLTLIIAGNQLTSYVNGLALASQTASSALVIPENDADFMIGQQFKGRMDEFRIWRTALEETEYLTQDPTVKGYLLWDNTVNKYHPDYSALLLYYKFDQNLCENIVDYTFRHHGVMNGVTREIVKDNPLFKYRIVSAYVDFGRFTDVPTDKAKYLLCNDLVALSARIGADGSAHVALPDDQGKLSGGALRLTEFKGRNGVLSLDGTGKMKVGTHAMNSSGSYAFSTWLYIDEWVKDGFLFKKEKNENRGISVRLGEEAEAEVVLRVNGSDYIYRCPGELVKGKWIYLGISTYNDNKVGQAFLLSGSREKIYPYLDPKVTKSCKLTEIQDVEATVGESFRGKLDETMIWNSSIGYNQFLEFAHHGANMPGFGKCVGKEYSFYAGCYWNYDRPKNPGYDSFSYKEYLAIMRSAYAGYRGYKIRLSVSGGGKEEDWKEAIADVSKRERFTTEMAAIINENDELLDGVDFDLEWPEYEGQGVVWTNYGKLVELMRSKLQPNKIVTISPHTVSYWFPKVNMVAVDYFLFQNYGPSKERFTYESFPIAYNKFLEWGYPSEKIVMSFATTTSARYENDKSLLKERDGVPVRIYNLGELNADDNAAHGYFFTGFNQTRWRSEQVKKKELGGIMCWSLNCDYPSTENPLSLFRASSFAIASNVDTLVTKVKINPVNVDILSYTIKK